MFINCLVWYALCAQKHLEGKTKSLTKEKFQEILQEVIVDTGFTGIGAKDTLFYIFGVPVAALMIKQRVMPRVISNDIFIPGITSATVFILAKLNKIWKDTYIVAAASSAGFTYKLPKN